MFYHVSVTQMKRVPLCGYSYNHMILPVNYCIFLYIIITRRKMLMKRHDGSGKQTIRVVVL